MLHGTLPVSCDDTCTGGTGSKSPSKLAWSQAGASASKSYAHLGQLPQVLPLSHCQSGCASCACSCASCACLRVVSCCACAPSCRRPGRRSCGCSCESWVCPPPPHCRAGAGTAQVRAGSWVLVRAGPSTSLQLRHDRWNSCEWALTSCDEVWRPCPVLACWLAYLENPRLRAGSEQRANRAAGLFGIGLRRTCGLRAGTRAAGSPTGG